MILYKILESVSWIYSRVMSAIRPTRIYCNQSGCNGDYIYVSGWDAVTEENVDYILTPSHIQKALGVTHDKSKWVYTHRGMLYMLDSYLHHQTECNAGNRIISVFYNDHPIKMSRSMIQCMNLQNNIELTRTGWDKIFHSNPLDKIELLKGDMTLVRLS